MLRAFCTGHTLQVHTQCVSDVRDIQVHSATATQGMQAGLQQNDLVSYFFYFFLLKVLCTGSAPQCQLGTHTATCRQPNRRTCTPWQCNTHTVTTMPCSRPPTLTSAHTPLSPPMTHALFSHPSACPCPY